MECCVLPVWALHPNVPYTCTTNRGEPEKLTQFYTIDPGKAMLMSYSVLIAHNTIF